MIKADLHIHSCLSPCASLDMGPQAIVERALQEGLTHIALTDHNSARNLPAVAHCAERAGLTFFPGIEVTTAEELHLLCYFDTVASACEFGLGIERSLLPVALVESMGEEVVVNADEEVEDLLDFYLGVTSMLSLDEIVKRAVARGGLAVPAHVDKPLFSIISQLGFVPEGDFAALELSYGAVRANNVSPFEVHGYPLLTSSDSHYPETIGRAFTVLNTDAIVERPSVFFGASLGQSGQLLLR